MQEKIHHLMRLQFSAFIQTCVVITFGKVRNTAGPAGHEPSNINIPEVSPLYELAYLQNHNNTPLGVLFMNKSVCRPNTADLQDFLLLRQTA